MARQLLASRPALRLAGAGLAALAPLAAPVQAQCAPSLLDAAIADDARAIATDGQIALVANGFDGLGIYDVSNPADLQLLTDFPIGLSCENVALDGDIAYVVRAPDQVQSLDISNPQSPVPLDIWLSQQLILEFTVADGVAYVTTAGTGLKLLDVSNPASIVQIGAYPQGQIAWFEGVWVEGSTVYLAGSNGGLQVLDATNPAAPVLLGSNIFADALGLTVSAGVAYVIDDGLDLYDVTNAAAPTLIGGIDNTVFASYARSVDVVDGKAFVGTSTGGIFILDILDPAAIDTLGTIPLPGQSLDVIVQDGVLFTGGALTGLRTYDVAGCLQPLGGIYCGAGNPNSTGEPARLIGAGSQEALSNDLQVLAVQLPPGQLSLTLASLTQANVPGAGGGQGTLCLGGDIARISPVPIASDVFGQALLSIDLSDIPTNPSQAVLAGQTWNFQVWYRDQNPGTTSNFSDALSVTFL